MAPSAPASSLRQILDERISQLLREAEDVLDARAARQAGEARGRARREAAEQLNQAVRRMRQAADVEELGAALLDAASAFAGGVALLALDGAVARGERIRGGPQAAEGFRALEIPLALAPALAAAVESRDPVVTATTPAEISPLLASCLDHPADARAWVFPVAGRERVAALVYAWGEVEAPPIELLTQVAAAVWSARPPAPEGFVSIAPVEQSVATEAASAPALASASAWERLSPEEQRRHLRAQRFARVQVARIRLFRPADVQAGRARRDLYGALREPIDGAREAFRKTYFDPCPSMVDYLHLEVLRTLANDDPELLGDNYPGVMV
jgi:ElaB/YqjD/DUF883 family membrane-anchored ribosome-binding protein